MRKADQGDHPCIAAGLRGRRRSLLLMLGLLVPVTTALGSGSERVVAAPAPRTAQPAAGATPRPSPASDVILSGFGDVNGYHVLAADAARTTIWQTVATIAPPVNLGSSWIGRQCLTEDGRFAVVVVAPSLASAKPNLVAHGGFAYSVDITGGKVIPLLSGVTLAYFSPACGSGHLVALTSFATADDAPSNVAIVDASTGDETAAMSSPDQVTSAVPLSSTSVMAVDGNTLVGITPTHFERIAGLSGQGYDLRPNATGGVDLLSADQARGISQVLRWSATAGLRSLGTVALKGSQLLGARNRSTVVVGSHSAGTSAPGLRWLSAPAGSTVEGISLNGDAQLLAVPSSNRLVLYSAGGERTTLSPPSTSSAPATAAIPAAITPYVDPRGRSTLGNTTTPTCAVPRLDVHHQVIQPSSAQINWAVEMATRGLLTNARHGDPTWGLSAYTPSRNFPLGMTVPREVMSGIIAAESNWDQASFHAAVGVAGNPLIANYYGTSADGSSRDYANADCGYGLTQQTDGMHVGDTLFPANTQQAVGLDYAENVAAGAWTLVGKWNQLKGLGIVANNGSPADIENWYFAIWAYNTGIHPNDGTGESGLGWSNNPTNPGYPPGRLPFLDASYADAAHPSDWPYQEQVLGWTEHPLLGGGSQDYPPAQKTLVLPPHSMFCSAQDQCKPGTSSDGTGVAYDANRLIDLKANWTTNQWVGATVTTVGRSLTGTVASNNANALTLTANWSTVPPSNTGYAVTWPAPCGRSDFHCWWHAPATWSSGCGSCTAGQWHLPSNAGEPATPTNPTPGVCNISGSPAPSAAAVIVDEEADGKPADLHQSLNSGCTGSHNWSNGGQFALSFGAVGQVDFHQLGAGFDGHTWFSHQVDPSNTGGTATGTWTPNLGSGGGYAVWVFVPSAAATATNATYAVNDGAGVRVSVTVNQNAASNAWVPLGQYRLHPGATVQLSNNEGNSGHDLAFNAFAFDPVAPLNPAYVAMGDSYSSGTGTGVWDAVSTQNQCYRSPLAYPTVLASSLSTTYATNRAFVACSGAVIANLSNPGFKGEGAQYAWLTTLTSGM